jgi:carbonic anhydrase
LLAGNESFIAGKTGHRAALTERRAETAKTQQPIAVVLTCYDSRVVPELIFDCTLGDLFVCRVAGNILEPGTIASFEYAISYFESVRALVVLGHQRCAAVTEAVAVLRRGRALPGNLAALLTAIQPAVESTQQGSMSDDAYVEAVIDAHARGVARGVAVQSATVRDAVATQRIGLWAARYSLDSGRVTLLT